MANNGDWMTVSLGQLGDFRNGANFSQQDYGPGFPIVNVKQLYAGRFAVARDLLELRKSSIKDPEAVRLKPGDILFARSSVKASGAGQVALVGPCPADAVFSGFIIRFRITDLHKACPAFVNYVLRSPTYRELLVRIGSGTTITNLSQDTLANLEINLPPLAEQRAIAHILGTLDDKIELNRRMNETLEALARALFKSWFVDFDPVRAKMEGRDTGLPKHLADLFASRLVDSELGEIPEGFVVGPILSQARLLSGGTPKTNCDKYWGGGIAWASAKDVSQCGETFLTATDRTITQTGLDESATQVIPALATVIVARGATTGRMAILGEQMAMNQTCYALVSEFNTPFSLYCQLRNQIGDLVHAAHGSVFDTITTRTFESALFILPPKTILTAFESVVDAALKRVLLAIKEARTLAILRDTLLPKLVSGELRLGDAGKVVSVLPK